MKVVRTEYLLDLGGFSQSPEWEKIRSQVMEAIRLVQWPPNSGSFTLHDEAGKGRGEGNGVKPIKTACMMHLKAQGWELEPALDVATVTRPGPIDAARRVGDRFFCVEWETGNISSSHRALNKIALGVIKKVLIGGVLIVPTREMYHYLTDRVGNFRELEPYFPLWRALKAEEGLLAVIAIEHDGVSKSVPRIPKGTDGRALM
jgi:hypothetical protein